MQTRFWWALAGLALMVGQGARASDIEGVYSVVGSNPGQPGSYKGEAQIKQTGKTYTIVWRVGESRQVGTGLLVDNVLSVVFTPVGAPRPGIAVFSVTDGKVSTGVWTSLGSQIVAEEVWSAADRP
jgi:hypothetical protein